MTIIRNKTRKQVWAMFPDAFAIVAHIGAWAVLVTQDEVSRWNAGTLLQRASRR